MTDENLNEFPFTDILVKTGNPKALDLAVNSFTSALLQSPDGSYIERDGGYVIRCFGSVGFLKYVIENQGYGEVVK